MAFNVNGFRASFSKGEPLKASNFEVRLVSVPNFEQTDAGGVFFSKLLGSVGIKFEEGNTAAALRYRCSNAVLPTKSLGTTTSKTYGPIRRMAYGSIHEPFSLTFILSDSMLEKELFTEWQKYITDDRKGDVKYYNDYIGQELHIVTFDRQGRENSLFVAREVYPVNVGDVQLGWDQQDQIATITVDFMYRYFEEKIRVNKQVPFAGLADRVGGLINGEDGRITPDFK